MTCRRISPLFLLVFFLQNSFINGKMKDDLFHTGLDDFSSDGFFGSPKKSIFDDDDFFTPLKSPFDNFPKKSIFDDPIPNHMKDPFYNFPKKNIFDDLMESPVDDGFHKTTLITMSPPKNHLPINNNYPYGGANKVFPLTLQPLGIQFSPIKTSTTKPWASYKDSSSQSSQSSESDEEKKLRKKKKRPSGTSMNFPSDGHIVGIVATHPGPSSIPSPCSTCGQPVAPPPPPCNHPIDTPCPHCNHAPALPIPAPYIPPAAPVPAPYVPPVTAPYVPPVTTPPVPSHNHWPLAGAALGGAAAGALAASAFKPSKPQPPLAAQPYPAQAGGHNENKCIYCIRPSCKPTVRPAPNFNAAADSNQLKKAMRGLGTKEETLVKILTRRSEDQIQQIVNEYTKNGQALRKDIEDDTSFKFKKLLVALVTPLPVFYAEQLHKALEHEDEDAVIEILTSLSDCAIREVNVAYNNMHKTTLPSKIERRSTFDFEKYLLALAEGKRDPNQQVNKHAASIDAQRLIDAGVAKWFGTDEATFIDIFAHRSFPQLRAIIEEYDHKRNASGGNMYIDIKKEFSGKLRTGLRRLVRNIVDQPTFFADELDDALEGTWTPDDNEKLIRIMRGRSGIDLGDIKDNFDRRYKKSLATRITELTYLEYKTALLSLLGVHL